MVCIPRWTNAAAANEARDVTSIHPMPEHEHEIPPDAATAADHRNPRRRRDAAQTNGEAPDLGVLVTPAPHHDLDRLVLHADVRNDIARNGWRTGERVANESQLPERYGASQWTMRQAIPFSSQAIRTTRV